MNFSIFCLFLTGYVFVAQADYRTNYGVQQFTRIIDEFEIISKPKADRQINLSVLYPGGVSLSN